MKLVPKLVTALKAFDRKLWPSHRVVLGPAMADLLAKRNVLVADVGVADAPEDRWLGIRSFIRFLTFDPNPRPQASPDERTVCLPIGLWSSKAKRTLYLTAASDACSLYPFNQEMLRDFLTKEGARPTGTTELELDTLDNCLAARPELRPDFLKIDTEGADLEVLRGADGTLRQCVMGIRVETAVAEFRLGAPLFGEIDSHLRERGFTLFHLSRVHFIRNNGLHGFTSQPQMLWGDAVYFLRREKLLERLAVLPSEERDAALVRFVVLLLCHGVHDYAIEVVDAAAGAKLVSPALAASVKAAVAKSADTSIGYFLWSAVGMGFSLAVYLGCWLVPSARLRAMYYVKQRAGRLFYDLCRWAALAGLPHNSCIDDPFV
jgi:FkbM family methyltransferase